MTSDPRNEQLFDLHARPGMIGLAGGSALVDRTIRKAQRRLSLTGSASLWSHAFLVSGRRMDGHHWVLESDLEIHHKQIRLGVQENRAAKYWDAGAYPNLALLDFGLSEEGTRAVLTTALDLLSGLSRYSLRELVGTLFAIRKPSLRNKENLLAREGAVYCSAFVQHCYLSAGLDLAPEIVTKNTTPQDLADSRLPHRVHSVIRQA